MVYSGEMDNQIKELTISLGRELDARGILPQRDIFAVLPYDADSVDMSFINNPDCSRPTVEREMDEIVRKIIAAYTRRAASPETVSTIQMWL